MNSDNSSDGPKNEVKQIDYYKLTIVEKDQILTLIQAATSALTK